MVLPHLKSRRTAVGVLSTVRALLGPEGLLMHHAQRSITNLESSNWTLYVESISLMG